MDVNQKLLMIEKLRELDNITTILNEVYKIIKVPICMFDTSYTLFTYTEGIKTDDPIWNEFVQHNYLLHETVNFCMRESFHSSYAESEILALMKSPKLKYDRINGKLFDKDGVQLGNIAAVFCERSIEDDDYKLLEALCEILSEKLQKSEYYNRIDKVYKTNFTDKFMKGRVIKTSSVRALVSQIYDGLKDNLFVGIVDITQYDCSNTLLAYFRDTFKKLQPEHKYYVHGNNVVMILSSDLPIIHIKKDIGVLNSFFSNNKLYAGISSCFNNLYEFKKYFMQAMNALNYGLKGKSNMNIFRYNDYSVEHFLNRLSEKTDLSNIFNPIAKLMQEHDKKNNTNYLETLYYYGLYCKNVDKTCSALNISAEKLNEQLDFLANLYEIDFDNGNMLTNIFITLKLMKV